MNKILIFIFAFVLGSAVTYYMKGRELEIKEVVVEKEIHSRPNKTQIKIKNIETHAIKEEGNSKFAVDTAEMKSKANTNQKKIEIRTKIYKLSSDFVNNRDELIDLYAQLIKVSQDEDVVSDYANFLIQIGDADAAEDQLNSCLKKFPDNELCTAGLTDIALLKDYDRDKKHKAFENCFNKFPNNGICMNNRTFFLMDERKYEDALDNVDKIINNAGSGSVNFDRGYLLQTKANIYTQMGNNKMYKEYLKLSCDEGFDLACQELIHIE